MGGDSPTVKLRLWGCSFMEGVWVDKPLLSAEMGLVEFTWLSTVLAAGNAAAVTAAVSL